MILLVMATHWQPLTWHGMDMTGSSIIEDTLLGKLLRWDLSRGNTQLCTLFQPLSRSREKKPDSKKAVWNCFESWCKNKWMICWLMGESGPRREWKSRTRAFSWSLPVKLTTIDWGGRLQIFLMKERSAWEHDLSNGWSVLRYSSSLGRQ